MTQNNSVLIIYEVVLNVNRLVVKSNQDLSTSAWDSIMDITKAAMDHVEVYYAIMKKRFFALCSNDPWRSTEPDKRPFQFDHLFMFGIVCSFV